MLESTLSAISITEFLPDSNDGKECVDHRRTDYLDLEAISYFFPTQHREAELWHFCLIPLRCTQDRHFPRLSVSLIRVRNDKSSYSKDI